MSYAAFKVLHAATGVELCAAAYLAHDPSDPSADAEIDAYESKAEILTTLTEYAATTGEVKGGQGARRLPNLVIAKGNVLEVYSVRVERPDFEHGTKSDTGQNEVGVMGGISAAWLDLVCEYRLHGVVESMAVLTHPRKEGRGRDSLLLTFREAKACVLHFDDASQSLLLSSMHFMEGEEWQRLKKGRTRYASAPIACTDPVGRCAAVLLFDCYLVLFKAAEPGYGIMGEDNEGGGGGGGAAKLEGGSYAVDVQAALGVRGGVVVKDSAFLHGYTEPVLALLHQEGEPTWAGRAALRRFTMRVTALSLNLSLRQHPVLWSTSELPYDAYRISAVPAPIGGVLVLAAHSLHYCSQAAAPCGLALNEYAVTPEGSPPLPRSKVDVDMDAAHIMWVAPSMALLASKTGHLFLLSLSFDGRTVQKLGLSAAREAVRASGICSVGPAFFFLASRAGDSLLVQYAPGGGRGTGPLSDSQQGGDETPSGSSRKRLKLEPAAPSLDAVGIPEAEAEAEVEASEEEEEALSSLYASAASWSPTIPLSLSVQSRAWAFAVRDSLVNLAPIRDMLVRPHAHELVAACGHGKSGALAVLQRSLRPDVITQVDLPGCSGAWTVYHRQEAHQQQQQQGDEEEEEEEEEFHAYLILSLHSRTMVLETGETLGEVTEAVQFYVAGPTLAAANLFQRRRVVQVYAGGVRLLDGAAMTQELLLGSGSGSVSVAAADICDPYVLLTLSDGSLRLLHAGMTDAGSMQLAMAEPSIPGLGGNPVTASSLYADSSRSFSLPEASQAAAAGKRSSSSARKEEEEKEQESAAGVVCVVGRQKGQLEMYALPSFRCAFRSPTFGQGPRHSSGPPSSSSSGRRRRRRQGRAVVVAIMSDARILCYSAFSFRWEEEPQGGGRRARRSLAGVRFARRPLEWVGALPQEQQQQQPQQKVGKEEGDDGSAKTTAKQKRMTVFSNVGGRLKGVFVAGTRPLWILLHRHHRPRAHPQATFAALHNTNCTHGFIQVTAQVAMGATVHAIAHAPQAGLLFVIASTAVQRHSSQLLAAAGGEQAQQQQQEDSKPPSDHLKEEEGEGEGVGEGEGPKVWVDDFELRVVLPPSAAALEGEENSGGMGSNARSSSSSSSSACWEVAKAAAVPLHLLENGLCLKVVTLQNTQSGASEVLLVMGTAFVAGEDVACRGRIVLFSIASSAVDDSSQLVAEVYSKEHKGAVSAIATLAPGYLLVAIGTKLNMHTWNGQHLNPIAFFDCPLYVVTLSVVKNYILVGDVHKSLYFVQWREEGAQLIMLAKDFAPMDTLATDFLIDGSMLSLLACDASGNLRILGYAPTKIESLRGPKLVPRGDFHAGVRISSFVGQAMLPALAGGPISRRVALLCGGLDGSISMVAPLDERTFRRLQDLQKRLVDAVPHVAGLHPRAFRRTVQSGAELRQGMPDSIIDCELLHHYDMLELGTQESMAKQIGTTRRQIVANLRDLAITTSFL
eukprot:jgi/Mesen1/924/ME000117S00085